jgi:hypothetical protein
MKMTVRGVELSLRFVEFVLMGRLMCVNDSEMKLMERRDNTSGPLGIERVQERL